MVCIFISQDVGSLSHSQVVSLLGNKRVKIVVKHWVETDSGSSEESGRTGYVCLSLETFFVFYIIIINY